MYIKCEREIIIVGMQIGVLKWLQFTKQKVHFPMQFLEPKIRTLSLWIGKYQSK